MYGAIADCMPILLTLPLTCLTFQFLLCALFKMQSALLNTLLHFISYAMPALIRE